MFRRTNKITALLVAAASIISVVPAMASDYTKVDSQDGTIYNAVAYKDGVAYVDAGINNKDDATYYLSNGDFKNLSDIDSGSDITAYGNKYVDAGNGDYFLDLQTGKVTTESIKSNAQDDAASALRKKVKADTDGRYLKDASTHAADTMQTLADTDQLPGSKFGEVWYKAGYTNKNAANGFAPSAGTLNVYTDGKGSYIDADYNLGKIKVTTTGSGVSDKTVTMENTNDTYDTATTKTVSAIVRNTDVIGQDVDYIYRTAKVTVLTTGSGDNVKISKINGLTIDSSTTAFDTTVANQVSFNIIQKISKAQASGDINGVKYAKTVTDYIISDDSAVNKNGDLYTQYSVVNGKLVNYKIDSTKTEIDSQTITLKSKNGYNYTDFADSANESVAKDTSAGTYAVDVDANGNLWRLDGGYIYRWDNDKSWNKVYKVDGSFNKLSVYDKDNIVTWNQDDSVYSVIGGTKAKTDTTTTDTTKTPLITAGWAKAADKTWSYVKVDGTKATGWLQDGNAWYYLKADGIMATGWINDNGTWYYLAGSGAMATGWINDNGTWYYLSGSGAMLANTTVNGYVLGANGAWVK